METWKEGRLHKHTSAKARKQTSDSERERDMETCTQGGRVRQTIWEIRYLGEQRSRSKTSGMKDRWDWEGDGGHEMVNVQPRAVGVKERTRRKQGSEKARYTDWMLMWLWNNEQKFSEVHWFSYNWQYSLQLDKHELSASGVNYKKNNTINANVKSVNLKKSSESDVLMSAGRLFQRIETW